MKETLKILSFQTAMVMQNEREKYDQTKWIYVPDFYTDYRYILGTVGNNPLITIGINPSTAEPEKMDNTMKSGGKRYTEYYRTEGSTGTSSERECIL